MLLVQNEPQREGNFGAINMSVLSGLRSVCICRTWFMAVYMDYR